MSCPESQLYIIAVESRLTYGFEKKNIHKWVYNLQVI